MLFSESPASVENFMEYEKLQFIFLHALSNFPNMGSVRIDDKKEKTRGNRRGEMALSPKAQMSW